MLKAFRIMAADFTENDEEFENEDDNSIIEISEEDNEDIPDLDNGSESGDDIVESEEDVPKEVMDCERSEADFDTAFTSRSFERLSCFPYTLQLIVSQFNEVHACKDGISRSKQVV